MVQPTQDSIPDPRLAALVMTHEAMGDSFKVEHAVFVTVDIVIIRADLARHQLEIGVIERTGFDQAGRDALPGGYMAPTETSLEAGLRELIEETRIDARTLLLREIGVADAPLRAKGKRVIGIFYSAFGVEVAMPDEGIATSDANNPRWVPLSSLRLPGSPSGSIELAFEGPEVVDKAIIDLRQHFDRHPPVAYVNGLFTISDLADFYETLHSQRPPIGPFQKAVLNSGLVTRVSGNDSGKPDGSLQWIPAVLTGAPVYWDVDTSKIIGVPPETCFRYEFGLQETLPSVFPLEGVA